MNQQPTPFEQGAHAAPTATNPYPDGSHEAIFWSRGQAFSARKAQNPQLEGIQPQVSIPVEIPVPEPILAPEPEPQPVTPEIHQHEELSPAELAQKRAEEAEARLARILHAPNKPS